MGDTYIKWLSELNKKDIKLAGGKGANLGEIYNAKFPVPPAFVVTTDAFYYFLKKTNLEESIKQILSSINVDETYKLQEKAKEIRQIITETKMPEDLEKIILEAYDHFNISLDDIRDSPGALAILRSAREPVFVSVRSSATAEDLGDASFAGQQDSFINVKGNDEVIEKVKAVFASIFTARSIYYRKKKGFDSLVGIAAVVQKMINSDKSGVMFSKHPVSGKEEILIESVWGQGEGIVSGKIKPDQHVVNLDLEVLEEKVSDKKLAIIRTASGQTKTIELTKERSNQRVLKTYEIKQLAEFALKLEELYKLPQDIEFAIEDDNIYILQTRPITTLKNKKEMQDIDGQILTQGLAASPGVASGIVKIVNSMDDLDKVKQGDILVTTMTNPDMVVTMQKAAAIVTSEGGVTAHAAIVSREMGIPAVVGTQNALDVLEDGMEITVDGFNGKVFSGIAENKSVEIEPIVETKTKIKVMVDLPQFAKRAAKTKAYGIGLIRLEGLIASSQKHPLAYEKEGKLNDYKEMLKQGLKQIAEEFISKPIWVRTSDIRSDEYSNLNGAPKEIERNPMLGFHGIRFSLKHPEIFKSELLAVKELIELGHNFGIMLPQVISIDEIKQTKKIMEELGCLGKIKLGVMIETPASSIIIKDICEEKIDFISFGTNDLTQYTLAIDRGNEDVQYIYNELNWAVLKQITRVIRECKKNNIETSICGQAGSNKEMVKFLIKNKIDSISVNADAAKEISEYVKQLEEEQEKENSKDIFN
ncbi:MAG: phosphoenolpyruvate synthase [Candidatus Nanoarchaeia archaeon]|jgi:pyruvate,water dikinase|nr:phosphoenolpyruvate synthase [Candidatus Nanoarchaeia archaeon]MDD3993876.1 phosphoenolpyruvate synthase [Candidatus Nanoarchaeia archaeon]MDD4563709.1 phosphoenolpyruvate synthase [Candidatus Nanoarchaeia archaeon]